VPDIFLIISFLGFLFVPLATLGTQSANEIIERTELRHAAAFPSLEWRRYGPFWLPKKSSVLAFPPMFEAWFNDHLGARPWLIRGYKLARLHGLTTAGLDLGVGNGAGSIVRGRDGWLFLGAKISIDDFRCAQPFQAQELAGWKRTLQGRRDWLANRGIEYVVVFAPNTATIYPEFMPREHTRLNDRSRLDQLLAALDEPGGVTVLDLRAPLRDAKTQYPVYRKTDTHWNELGAYVAYARLMSHLAVRWPAARPQELSAFDIEIVNTPGGDLAVMFDSPERFREDRVYLRPKQARRAARSVFHDGAHDCQGRISTNPRGPLTRAVVLHDSFFGAMMPFFSEHWQRVRYAATYEFPLDLIEEEKPLVVVQEIVERRLMEGAPSNPPEVSGSN
jgi:hypothetical protein